MKRTNYTRRLTPEDKVRIYFEKDRGRIMHFVIQYYALLDKQWITIIRIDTCHGYAHKHVYHKRGREYCSRIFGDLGDVFTEHVRTVINSFPQIKQNYLLAT